MNLTVIENKTLENLPVQQREYVVAKFSPTIKSMPPLELSNSVLDLVQTTLIESGVKDQSDVRVVKFLSDTLFTDLQQPKYNHLSFNEIKLALRNGVRLEYGQYMGINITTLHHWIKSYMADKKRQEALELYRAQLESQNTSEVPVHIRIDQSKEGIKAMFQRYKDTGRLDMVAFAYYDILKDLIGVEHKGFKTLVPDEQVRKEIFAMIDRKHENSLMKAKAMADFRGDLSESEAIMQKITEGYLKDDLVNNKKKSALLKHYFDQLIKEGKNLEI